MRRIVFLVKNYIGFGHIRRTLLIAEQIHALDSEIDIVFISQAKSLLLFKDTPFRVINFPFLQRLPTNALAAAYKVLLEQIIANLQPSLIIEDTYPDEWYLAVPALQNVPKLLLLRRIDAFTLDDFRKNGYFSIYDRVLVVHEKEEFFVEKQIPETDLLFKLTDRFRFIGPVFRLPSAAQQDQMRRQYFVPGQPLVVVNAGAGGDHFNEAYCEQLFMSIDQIAQRCLQEGISAHFLCVIGPYYSGIKPQARPNMRLVEYEPHLAALLSIADIVVIRPGYNVLHEALAGTASIIVIPGISYGEKQHFYTEQTRQRFHLHIGNYADPMSLYTIIVDLLRKRFSETARAPLLPSQQEAAIAIFEELATFQSGDFIDEQCKGLRLFLLVGGLYPTHAHKAQSLLCQFLPQVTLVADHLDGLQSENLPNLDYLIAHSANHHQANNNQPQYVFLQSSAALDFSPELLIRYGIRVVLYTSKATLGSPSGDGIMSKEWCYHYAPQNHGFLVCELYHFEVMPGQEIQQLSYRVAKLFLQSPPIAIYLDLSLLREWQEVEQFITNLSRWKERVGCYLLTLEQAMKNLAMSRLAN